MGLPQPPNTAVHAFVTSGQEYGDFILELDLKDDPGLNTGSPFRCAEAAAAALAHARANFADGASPITPQQVGQERVAK